MGCKYTFSLCCKFSVNSSLKDEKQSSLLFIFFKVYLVVPLYGHVCYGCRSVVIGCDKHVVHNFVLSIDRFFFLLNCWDRLNVSRV